MNSRFASCIAVALAFGPAMGCSNAVKPVNSVSTSRPAPAVDQRIPEPWISGPQSDWPQLVLTNQAEFQGDRTLFGASSFLIQNNSGRVLAATAEHLVGPAGGVEPAIPIRELAAAIKSWRMYPRTRQDSFVEISGPVVAHPIVKGLDWLVLDLKQAGGDLPAVPLKVRSYPVEVGESVFLIGCPYSERDCRQNVYRGLVTARAFKDKFRYDLDPPVDIRGFSGAPIIDNKGFVVGVMTVWFEPKMSGDKFLEAGGEDIATIHDFVQSVK